MSDDYADRRRQYLQRETSLLSERSAWDVEWRELSQFIQPRKSRFFLSDTNRGQKKGQSIINAAATRANRIQASGIFAGVTSPARPWLGIRAEDPDLADFDPVKEWLAICAKRTLLMLAGTNLYNALHAAYVGLGWAGTDSMLVEEDPRTVLWVYRQPVGEYCLTANERGEVDTLFRRARLTVRQTVRKFGENAVSDRVRERYRLKRYDEPVDVLHVIEPREEYDPGRQDGRNKPISSCWMELDGDAEGFLRESGYDESPLVATRWDVLDGDVYGTGPGHEARGDVKALQLYERRKAQAVERMVDPPLQAATALRGLPLLLKPGGVTYADPLAHGRPIEPTIIVDPRAVAVTGESARETVQRINQAYNVELWLMMAQGGDPQKTATEIAARKEEQLLQLGPVMERLEVELLTPLVARALSIQLRHGLLPPPPPEIQGQPVRIEYMSIMAQAQRMVHGSAVRQFTGYVVEVAQVDPTVLDVADTDEMTREMAEALGLGPKATRPEEVVQERRQQRAQAEAQKAQQEQQLAAAQRMKTLSEANTGGDNALSQLVGGIAAAQTEGAP